MEPVTLTLGIRGVIALLLAVGGVLALWFGFVLFRDGSASRASASLKFSGLKANASGVGAVVMITAAAWAYLSVLALPKLKTPQSEVAFTTPNGTVFAPQLTIHSEGIPTDKADQLAELFSKAAHRWDVYPDWETHLVGKGGAKIYVYPAKIGKHDVTVTKSESGQLQLATKFRANSGSATITYTPVFSGNVVKFYPTSIADVEFKGASGEGGGNSDK